MPNVIRRRTNPSPNLSPKRREALKFPDFSRDLQDPSPNLSPIRREALISPPSLPLLRNASANGTLRERREGGWGVRSDVNCST